MSRCIPIFIKRAEGRAENLVNDLEVDAAFVANVLTQNSDAAGALLRACTGPPAVANPGFHPLPRRASQSLWCPQAVHWLQRMNPTPNLQAFMVGDRNLRYG